MLVVFVAASFASEQLTVPKVEQMPNLPSPYIMRDWKQVALDYDAFVFDFTKIGDYLPLIWWDNTKINTNCTGFGMPSYVGMTGQASGNHHESINCMGAVLGATLAGIDKSNQNGNNWVLMLENYYSSSNGQNLYLNNIPGSTGGTFWYEILPSILFYQLNYYYPGTGNMEQQFITTADRWFDASMAMGGSISPWELPNYAHTAFNFMTMQPVDNGVWLETDVAAAIAWVEFMAYKQTGNPDYLIAADWALQYIQSLNVSPLYDLLLCYAPYVSARMNAEYGRNYDTLKFMNMCFDGNIHNWGVKEHNWGGLDCGGLVSSSNYAFFMETVNYAGAIVPVARYDQRYARAIGKWMLNLANSCRLFYSAYVPQTNQTSYQWASQYDPQSCIAYEGLKKSKTVYDKAQGEQKILGNVTAGNYTATHARDNVYQVLTETIMAGGKDGLEYIWEVPLSEGSYHQLVIKSHMVDAGDADSEFKYYYSQYSTGPYAYLFSVGSPTDIYRWTDIVSNTGYAYIRVIDDNRVGGNYLYDSLYVDEIYIMTRNYNVQPYASGDPLTWGWGDTDLGLYGSAYAGILGGIVSTTNVEKILELDLLKTDYYRPPAYPTSLYYNPYSEPKVVTKNVGTDLVDLYDTVSHRYLAANVSGDVDFTIQADSAVVIVTIPAGAIVTLDQTKRSFNGIVVDYRAEVVLTDCASKLPSEARFIGDVDQDCCVGIADLVMIAGYWLETEIWAGWSDINQDGIVDFSDISLLGVNWNKCQ